MKKIFLASSVLLLHLVSTAQHTEFSVGVNAAKLSFRGANAVRSSFVIVSDIEPGSYTNDLFSKKSGTDLGFELAAQRITKKKIIYGISTGIELLTHVIPITSVSDMWGSHAATGNIHVHSQFLNIKPMAGYRFLVNKNISVDLAASLDIAIGLADLEEAGLVTITGSGEVIHVNNSRGEVITDIRPGLQAKLNVKHFSLLIGYWLGQSNYYKGYIGGSPEAYSKLFRFGLSYRLNKSK